MGSLIMLNILNTVCVYRCLVPSRAQAQEEMADCDVPQCPPAPSLPPAAPTTPGAPIQPPQPQAPQGVKDVPGMCTTDTTRT